MTPSTAPLATPLTLPSDQDASGRSFGTEELELLEEALASGVLTSTKGRFVRLLEQRFAGLLGVPHATACSSGTAAIHAAVAALDPEPGDEIVTSPITDMGAITPILYQGAIPVFADVDPRTCNVTAETIERVLSPRTKAIIVTHLFGNPCSMAEILNLAQRTGIPIIEDCAQAYLAQVNGKYVGTLGTLGCFSLQQGKHITCGEGGLVVTNDDKLARHVYLFVNKAWGYGDPQPDHYFLALNYRMSELQGAVAVAQLAKLPDSVRHRIRMAERLTKQLKELDGITSPFVEPGRIHVYWRYCLLVDSRIIPGGVVALGQLLRDRGIACLPRYIQKPAFQCKVI
ncbi:MAG: DegT/DnrJ/EryC1/StrS family aminotransferase, partial [Gemmatales bacterium]|nr:DegT/DnrJ/EryC1/StrS family aminotransferase [Gemmatales bacterium]MDW8388119.1 DegT/DnrJ/EryC1/StrS family aminotransferase [Gemmatales bacterium]